MDSVVVMWHVHEIDGDEDTKFIGVYRSEEDAIAAIERLKDKPGFAQTSDGFVYERYELNADHWIDGFKEVDALS
jgi:homoserine kinase type II